RIAPPGAVVDLVAHRLAVLAVARHGDTGFDLAAHDVGHSRSELLLERRLVGLARFARPIGLDEIVRPRQAAGVAGEGAIAALAHGQRPLNRAGLRFSAKARAASWKSSLRYSFSGAPMNITSRLSRSMK